MQHIIHAVLHIHTYKITCLFLSLFKNRFCKHCFRSFRHGSSISLLQSVSSYLVENIQRLLQVRFFFPFNFLAPRVVRSSAHPRRDHRKRRKSEEPSQRSTVGHRISGREFLNTGPTVIKTMETCETDTGWKLITVDKARPEI